MNEDSGHALGLLLGLGLGHLNDVRSKKESQKAKIEEDYQKKYAPFEAIFKNPNETGEARLGAGKAMEALTKSREEQMNYSPDQGGVPVLKDIPGMNMIPGVGSSPNTEPPPTPVDPMGFMPSNPKDMEGAGMARARTAQYTANFTKTDKEGRLLLDWAKLREYSKLKREEYTNNKDIASQISLGNTYAAVLNSSNTTEEQKGDAWAQIREVTKNVLSHMSSYDEELFKENPSLLYDWFGIGMAPKEKSRMKAVTDNGVKKDNGSKRTSVTTESNLPPLPTNVADVLSKGQALKDEGQRKKFMQGFESKYPRTKWSY